MSVPKTLTPRSWEPLEQEELCCRSVRACVSQNGSYSRQAELRLLAFLYPGEEGQDCSSTSWRQHNRRRADVWSSDDEETAGREGNPPPLAGEDLLQLETLLA